MSDIEERILNAQEKFHCKSLKPPKLLILPFNDYLELQEFAEGQSKTVYNSGILPVDYSYGKMYLGMIVTFDYDATEIIIKGASK